jgi:hypothetical protein
MLIVMVNMHVLIIPLVVGMVRDGGAATLKMLFVVLMEFAAYFFNFSADNSFIA